MLSETELREQVIRKIREAGFVVTEDHQLYPPDDKELLRQIHRPAVRLELTKRQKWLRQHIRQYLRYFADGADIVPERIEPTLVEVVTDEQRALFLVARLLWSLPFSSGVGRRLRFLVMDKANGKLIGLLALQSPPLDFAPRDCLFRYPEGRKTELVNQTMDIYTLGAVQPYSDLLGGKLIALIAAANEIRQIYRQRYSEQHLVALTTTSAFGRSSLYNRLKYKDTLIAESLGYTKGYGIFHLHELYPSLCSLLVSKGFVFHRGLDTGPRPKWQNIAKALRKCGLSPGKLLRHRIRREAFLFRLVDNLKDYMEGRDSEPVYRDLPFSDLVSFWRERWLLPRAEREDRWKKWNKEAIRDSLLIEQGETAMPLVLFAENEYREIEPEIP